MLYVVALNVVKLQIYKNIFFMCVVVKNSEVIRVPSVVDHWFKPVGR